MFIPFFQVKRADGDNDSNYYDVFEIGQDVYEFLMDQIRMHTSEGTSVVSGNSTIVKWPMGNAQLSTMRTIARIADVPKNMKEIGTYKLPDELWNQLLHVNYPKNYNANGMVVPKPETPPLSDDAFNLGSELIDLALTKFKSS